PPPPSTYTLSLHDALPIYAVHRVSRRLRRHGQSQLRHRRRRHGTYAHQPRRTATDAAQRVRVELAEYGAGDVGTGHRDVINRTVDRKSTRLNSSHVKISYA